MKILIVVRRSPVHRFLVDVDNKSLVKDCQKLISKNKHSDAMVLALTKGRFDREIFESELPKLKADMILREDGVSWDLT